MVTPICYPAMNLSSSWTEEPDSQTGGRCRIVTGTPSSAMEIMFAPNVSLPGKPWANAYCLQRHSFELATKFAYSATVLFPTAADIAACEAFELDRQDNDGFTIFNCGWQFLIGKGVRLWNRATKQWQPPVLPAISAAFFPGVPKRITVLHQRDNSHVTYLGVGVDNIWTPLDITYDAVPQHQHPYINNAIQLDSKGKGAPINLAVTECSLVGF